MTVTDRRPALLLAGGIVALEFAAAVSAFVASTLLPTVAGELGARDHLGLLLAGSTLGLFVALPLAPAALRRLGPARTLAVGMVGYVGGTAASAFAPDPWTYAAGRFTGGLAGGLLAVFGISAAIRLLDDEMRVRVVAASSAMWILPALVGPPATLALEHAVGWRWALLAPVPIVLAGRALVARAAVPAAGPGDDAPGRPPGRTLLVPAGVAVLVMAGTDARWWPVAVLGAAVALVGVARLLPPGTVRARPGAPAALAAMLLFGTGWFGADGLITVLLTDGYGTSVARAAVVLSAAPLAWAVTSLLARRVALRLPPAAGLAMAAGGVALLAGSSAYAVALVAWTVAGVGIGLAYPALYVACTPSGRSDAAELATAVLTAESFGALLGAAAGGGLVSLAGATGLSRDGGLALTYAVFAVVLTAGALVATRAGRAA